MRGAVHLVSGDVAWPRPDIAMLAVGSEPYPVQVAFERITVDPARMGGLPCIRGMRVTVSMVLGQLAAGQTIEQILADYPYLERADVLATLEYAAAIAQEREVPLARPA